MFEFSSVLAKGVIQKGYDKFVQHIEFKRFIGAGTEQLRRELCLNIEIISEFIPISKHKTAIEVIQYANAFEEMKTSSFDSIANGVIPLSLLFPNEIDGDIYTKTIP